MVSVKQNPIGMDGKGSKPTTVKEAQANAKLLYNQVMSALDATNALLDRTPLNDKMTRMKLERAKRELLDRYDKASRKLVGSYENPNGGLSQHKDKMVSVKQNPSRYRISKSYKTLKQAEKFQNLLFNKYDVVQLVASPRFSEGGLYVWEVSTKATDWDIRSKNSSSANGGIGLQSESRALNEGRNPNSLSQHIDAAFDAAASGDRGGLTTTKAAIRKALNSAKQPEGQKAREYIFGVLDIIVKNRSKWSGAQIEKAVREYSAAVYDRVLPKLDIKQNPRHTNNEAFTKEALAYIRSIKNKPKKEFAELYFHKLLNPNSMPETFSELHQTFKRHLSFMGRQAVEMRLREILNNNSEIRNHTATDFHAKQNPEIMGRYVSEAVLDNVFTQLTQYYQSSAKDKKAGLPNLVRYLELKVGGLSERQAKAYIGVMEKHLMPRKNHTASDFTAFKQNRSKEHFKMFQGKQPSGSVRVLQPDSAPKETSRLGDLVLMKVIKSNGSKQNINFDGEAFLAIDLRKNLWAIGKDARINNVALPRKGELKYLGKLKQIDYVTAKKHIGGNKLTRFWHELGEVDKNYPSLYVDADGFPIIHGGGYDVWNIGIVN